MIKIKVGERYLEFNEPVNSFQIAEAISVSLKKEILFSEVNGELKDASFMITKDSEVELIKDGEEAIHVLNHSCAHLMAEAIKNLYPEAKFGVGPAIEEGYYYDVLVDRAISEEDFKTIEKEMKRIASANEKIERHEVSKKEALELFKDDELKHEIISDVDDSEIISYYTQGSYKDFCRGPHLPSTKYIKYFKLLSVAGAYFRGDSKRQMLQRIYGIACMSQEDLDAYMELLKERKERDHRKLGKDLGIFMFDDLVGRGLPLWLPNGFIVRRGLCDYIMNKEIERGYKHVMTPSLGNINLYKTSGHFEHYHEDMFPAMELDDESYVLRPMNCPHHMVMFKSSLHSYRELPLRIAEIANDFRFEPSGALTGIERTRAFTQNDSHIFCTEEQIASEFKGVAELILDVYKDFGIKDYKFRLSLRDPENLDKYFGNDALWEKSENELRKVLKDMGVDYYEALGEAAFYGPKLDVQVKSAIGHDVTLSTIQLDYQLPEKFELTYIDQNGEKARPVVIHRAILGSLDRFVAYLLEETKGNLPTWLAPVQVKVIPVNLDVHMEFSENLVKKLSSAGVRVEKDYRNEKLGYKIREAQTQKIPYQLVIGDKEISSDTVTYRRFGSTEQITVSTDEFVNMIQEEIRIRG